MTVAISRLEDMDGTLSREGCLTAENAENAKFHFLRGLTFDSFTSVLLLRMSRLRAG